MMLKRLCFTSATSTTNGRRLAEAARAAGLFSLRLIVKPASIALLSFIALRTPVRFPPCLQNIFEPFSVVLGAQATVRTVEWGAPDDPHLSFVLLGLSWFRKAQARNSLLLL